MLKFTPDGKVDRHNMMIRYSWADMADALDECVAAMRHVDLLRNDSALTVETLRMALFDVVHNAMLEIGAEE